MKPCVLLLNLPEEKERKIRAELLVKKVRGIRVDKSRFGEKLFSLFETEKLGGEGKFFPEEESFTEELLVMAHFDNALLDAFLGTLRKKHLSVALKAILTPANSEWTVIELYRELCAERKAIEENAAFPACEKNEKEGVFTQ